jgi:hypothetical protein
MDEQDRRSAPGPVADAAPDHPGVAIETPAAKMHARIRVRLQAELSRTGATLLDTLRDALATQTASRDMSLPGRSLHQLSRDEAFAIVLRTWVEDLAGKAKGDDDRRTISEMDVYVLANALLTAVAPAARQQRGSAAADKGSRRRPKTERRVLKWGPGDTALVLCEAGFLDENGPDEESYDRVGVNLRQRMSRQAKRLSKTPHLVLGLGLIGFFEAYKYVILATVVPTAAVPIIIGIIFYSTYESPIPCAVNQRGCKASGETCVDPSNKQELFCDCPNRLDLGRWVSDQSCAANESGSLGRCELGGRCRTEEAQCVSSRSSTTAASFVCHEHRWTHRNLSPATGQPLGQSVCPSKPALGQACTYPHSRCLDIQDGIARPLICGPDRKWMAR